MTTGWREYFDGLTQESRLLREQAIRYVGSLCAAVELRDHHRLLDFGCGFGHVATLLAPRVGQVWWWEPSPNMRSVAERNTAGFSNVQFCDLSTLPFAGPPFDVILVNSVVQYMATEEFWPWLQTWRDMLGPGGRLVLSDVIPLKHTGVSDIADLLRLAVHHGSPLRSTNEALGGMARYWRATRSMPLTRLDRADLARGAATAGLETRFLEENLTHFRKRWTAVLHPQSQI